MPVLSGRVNFVPFLTTSKKNFPKIPMNYSKNGQKFAMSENTSNVFLGHPEHHAKNRTSLHGLDHDTLFFG